MTHYSGTNMHMSPASSTPSPSMAYDGVYDPNLKHKRAIEFLRQVKYTFHHQPHVYPLLITVLKDFKSQAINRSEVIRQVRILFKDHQILLEGFDTFLPPGWSVFDQVG